jgi:DUF1365 family protein
LTETAIYFGAVVHQRFRPKLHRLRYRLAQLLIDIDELEGVTKRLRLFSYNRFNLIAFYDSDHGDRSNRPLREQVEALLRPAGVTVDGGAIRLLTMPRICGHVFNPISTWFCFTRDGRLRATIYEVTNTFKDRHFYVIPAEPDDRGSIRQSCEKALYVSPFMDLAMQYDFALKPPDARVSLVVTGSDCGGKVIVASFVGKREALNDAALLRLLLGLPLMTLRVVVGIHWEAMKLWLKGIAIRRHSGPSDKSVTIGRQT